MDDYNLPAKIYWWATTSLGAMALVAAIVTIARFDSTVVAQIALGMTLAAVTGAFPIRIPGAKTSIAGAEIIIFVLLLMHGPAAAAVAAAAEAAVGSWRTSQRWTSRIGSPALACLAMYACGTAFSLAVAWLQGGDKPVLAVLIGLLLLLAVAYFVSATLLMASLNAIKLSKSLHPFGLLKSHGVVCLVYAASAAIAGLLYVSFERLGAGVFLAAVPIIAVFLSTHHFYFRQLEATELAQRQKLAAAEREASEAARHLAELRKSETRFQKAFSHAAIGMALISSERRILQANPALCQLLGTTEPELVETSFTDIFRKEDVEVLRSELSQLLSGRNSVFSMPMRCPVATGADKMVSLYGSLFTSETTDVPCLIVQVQDITERDRAERRLLHIASHDDLTTLPNRGHFLERLAQAITTTKRSPESQFAVLFLDFDRFKLVNDSMGHRAGDELLVILAQRIKSRLRPSDVVARLGGDEFAILLTNLRSSQDAVDLADRLQESLRKPIRLRMAEVATSVSIGITTSAFDYDSPEDVMRDADTAMYRAKALGKARYALFDSALHAEVSSQMWLEGELRRAIEQEQLHLAYQPIMDLRSGQIIGVEALCRWSHSERGAMRPDQFIRVAEDTGMIIPLGTWVLEQSCRQLQAWEKTRAPGASRLSLHINVSGMQLVQPDFGRQVQLIIEAAGVDPSQIILEITESVLIDRLSVALPNLLALRACGVEISIDDFGTGYSSLSALHELPISEIKIDRSFVDRMITGDGEEVVRAIVAMGHALGKRVIAEGIETREQLRQLIELGCGGGQGYFLARPLSPSDADVLIKKPDAFLALA